MDFSGLSLIKLKKEEMEAQVSAFTFSSPPSPKSLFFLMESRESGSMLGLQLGEKVRFCNNNVLV